MTGYKTQQAAGLTLRQIKFAEIMAVGNVSGAEAARQAGYAGSNARRASHVNLKQPQVLRFIEDLRDAHARRNELSADMVTEGLLKLAHHADSSAARVRAWELLGKTLGMFIDKTQIEQVTTFADELESLQDEIKAAIAEKGRQGRYDAD